jgi:hypothetical protein
LHHRPLVRRDHRQGLDEDGAQARPRAWRCDAQTCREENSEAFAGQHAPTSTSFYIFDEASASPMSINEVSEGGMTDGEPMKFAFGNPTRNTGWFADCFKRMAHRWGTRQIDSRSVQITNKSTSQRVDRRLRPRQRLRQGARARHVPVACRSSSSSASPTWTPRSAGHLRPEQYNWAPKILTLDNAWEGDDEARDRHAPGLEVRDAAHHPEERQRSADRHKLAQLEDDRQADAVFIDGGFGTGIVSVGRTLGRNWQLVWFSGEVDDPGCLNKRAEMWKAARDWLKAGGSIRRRSMRSTPI